MIRQNDNGVLMLYLTLAYLKKPLTYNTTYWKPKRRHSSQVISSQGLVAHCRDAEPASQPPGLTWWSHSREDVQPDNMLLVHTSSHSVVQAHLREGFLNPSYRKHLCIAIYSPCAALTQQNKKRKQYLPPWSPQHPARLDQHLLANFTLNKFVKCLLMLLEYD